MIAALGIFKTLSFPGTYIIFILFFFNVKAFRHLWLLLDSSRDMSGGSDKQLRITGRDSNLGLAVIRTRPLYMEHLLNQFDLHSVPFIHFLIRQCKTTSRTH